MFSDMVHFHLSCTVGSKFVKYFHSQVGLKELMGLVMTRCYSCSSFCFQLFKLLNSQTCRLAIENIGFLAWVLTII
jgi:predicted DNA-binding helix-hairpin-helix protein